MTTNAGGSTAINGATITTTGAQTYNDAVTLGAGTTLTTTDSAVTFGSTLDNAQALTVSTGSGAITFTGVVGGTTALGALTLNSTGVTTFSAAVTAASVTTNAGGSTRIPSGLGFFRNKLLQDQVTSGARFLKSRP